MRSPAVAAACDWKGATRIAWPPPGFPNPAQPAVASAHSTPRVKFLLLDMMDSFQPPDAMGKKTR